MAFSDSDLHSHMRRIGLTGEASITNYGRVDDYGVRDPLTKEGKTPHMADLREKNEKSFTLAHVEGSLRWQK